MTTEAGAAREYSRGMTSVKRGLQETLADDDYDYTSEILCFRSGKKNTINETIIVFDGNERPLDTHYCSVHYIMYIVYI